MAVLNVGRCCGAVPIEEQCGDGTSFLRCPVCGCLSKSIAVHLGGREYIINFAAAKAAIDGSNYGDEVDYEQRKGYSGSADGSGGL